MRKEYDFSKAVKAKFFVNDEDIETPIYLDKNVCAFYKRAAESKQINLSTMINNILKKEMEIHNEIMAGK